MYCIELKQFFVFLNSLTTKPKVSFLSCISFEPRCKKGISIANEYKDKIDFQWILFKIIDNGSKFEEECSTIQDKHEKEILDEIKIEIEIPKYKLFNIEEGPEECLIS